MPLVDCSLPFFFVDSGFGERRITPVRDPESH